MSDIKKSFVLYTDYQENILLLSKEQRGDLLTLIMAYASGDTLPEVDGMTQMAFSFIKSQMDKDAEKYSEVIEKRREAGKQGGRPKANGSGEKAKKANGFSEKQSEAKKPDNGFINVNDNELVKDIKENTAGKAVPRHQCRDNRIEYPYREVVACLNEKTGAAFSDISKDTRKHIKARCDEGHTLTDFISVIDKKVAEWGAKPKKGEKDMRQYLRPSTLFGTKFESYLNQQIVIKSEKGNGFQNCESHGYDYDKMMWDIVSRQEVSDALPE